MSWPLLSQLLEPRFANLHVFKQLCNGFGFSLVVSVVVSVVVPVVVSDVVCVVVSAEDEKIGFRTFEDSKF